MASESAGSDFEHGVAGLPPNAAFVISVAARLVGVHEQTLRYYERAGLVVALGLSLNLAAVWGMTAVVKRRLSSTRKRARS